MAPSTPEWVKHAVFYQIFPDRFARSSRIHHPRGIHFKPWGSPPQEQGYQGGDLLAIVDRLDYLADLGVNALYLNPIFASAANHRYHTYDYLCVDPLLGGDAALRELLDAAHSRGIRVVLDAVFNHAGRGFWAFHHILENGGDSPYIDWFTIHGWPLRPYEHGQDRPHNYAAWWDLPALPKFNTTNPGVRDYLLQVARHWIDFGIDGWRMDVPEEIPDPTFWRDFRRVTKSANPDVYLVGEVWHDAQEWLQGDRFDGVMNYVFSRSALGFFGATTLRTDYKPGGYALCTYTAQEFAQAVEQMLNRHPWEVNRAQLNLLDSHDTARTLWTVNGDESALRLCVLFQMTMPGAPCVYYGDEVGMTGANDPYCRAAFPWHDEVHWNLDLLQFYRRAIALRHHYPVLRTGTFSTLLAEDGVYAYLRQLADQIAVVIFNTNPARRRMQVSGLTGVPAGTILENVWHLGIHRVHDETVTDVVVPGRDCAILIGRAAAAAV